MAEFLNNLSFQFVVQALIGAFALFGGAKLLEMSYSRYLAKRDLHLTENTNFRIKELEVDEKFTLTILERLQIVEKANEKLNEKCMTLSQENAELRAENKNMRRENEMQERELAELRDELHQTRVDLQQAQKQIDELMKKFEK